MAMMLFDNCYDVVIKDLEVVCFVGIYESEYHKKQPLILNVRITVARSDGLPKRAEDLICYDSISKWIENMLQEQHHDLVEDVLQKVASYILSQSHVVKVWLSVMKPQAVHHAKLVGVEATFVK